jgi:hypothetical protein
MSPQGFGFESRRGERRSGKDRRVGERRLIGVLADRRRVPDRRLSDRRVSNGPRRILPDRRSFSFRSARGLRITNEVKFYLPPEFLQQ